MTLLLTKTCQYAVLVAIEDGRFFSPSLDRDLFIHSRLNFKLPEDVDDLIPPSTLICTEPVTCSSSTPSWRTTLCYFVSTKILHRLREYGGHVTLELFGLSVAGGSKEMLGQINMPISNAQFVRIKKKSQRDIAQIKDYVVDKGDWHDLSNKNRAQVRAGLFVVDMPPTDLDRDKTIGTPLRKPFKTTTNDIELQSEFGGSNNTSHHSNSTGSHHLHLQQPHYQLVSPPPSSSSSSAASAAAAAAAAAAASITTTTDSRNRTFCFRILEATYISSLTSTRIKNAYFHYSYGTKKHIAQATISRDGNTWIPSMKQDIDYFRLGDNQVEGLRDKHINVYLVAEYYDDNNDDDYDNTHREIVGLTYVRTSAITKGGITKHSFPVYDRTQQISITPEHGLARVTVLMGLVQQQQQQQQRLPPNDTHSPPPAD